MTGYAARVGGTPARSTTKVGREVLERIWITDPLSGYAATMSQFKLLTTSPKLKLTD